MHVQKAVFLVAMFTAAQASASSIEAVEQSAVTPSIITLSNSKADPSIVAAPPLDGPAPSIIALADTPAGDNPDVITLGAPAPAGEATSSATDDAQRVTMPMVIRGGDVGQAYARPSPASSQPAATPLLDPNDRGTPAKRNALKRQAERLAREAAAGGGQPDPSTETAPLGQ
jgi:hypothetical protein